MSGSHYLISYSQILESERRLQLSNILKLFDHKTKYDAIAKPILIEYLSTFSHANDERADCTSDIHNYISRI